MKVIKNKIFKFFMYVIGFAALLTAFFCVFEAVASYSYLLNDNADRSVPFAETPYVKGRVNNTVYFINASVESDNRLKDIDIEDRDITVYDLKTGDKEKTKISKFLETNNVADALFYGVVDAKGNSFYTNDDYDYVSHISENPSGEFIKLNLSDYLKYIKDNGFKYDQSVMNRILDGDSGVVEDPEEIEITGDSDSEVVETTEYTLNIEDSPVAEGNQSGYSNTTYINDDADIESIYRTIYNNLSGDLYINEFDDVYVLADSGVIVVYNATHMYLYRIGGLVQQGHQDLESLDSTDVYLPYTEDLNTEFFVNAYMYCSKDEAVFGMLTEKEKSIIKKMCQGYSYDAGVNSAYSIDGSNISDMNIYDTDDLQDIYAEEDGKYNISFRDFRSKVEKSSDVFVSYNADSKELVQWYKNDKGEKKDFEYINDTLLNSITKKNEGSFVIGMKLYDKNSNFRNSYLTFKVSQLVPYPITFAIICFLVFLSTVVVLTIGEDRKLIWADKLPYVVYVALIVLVGVAIISFFILTIRDSSDLIDMFMTEPTGMILAFLVTVLAAYLFFAFVYLSVVRRIKCKQFLNGFITIWLVKYLYKSLKLIKGKTKLIIAITTFIVLTFIMLLIILNIGLNDEVIIPVLLIALVDIVASVMVIRYMADIDRIAKASKKLENGELDTKVDTSKLIFNNKDLGESLNNLGEGLSRAVESSVRDERTKAELITNVSHDIKTPLTSIISYVDLLKREKIDNPKANEYIEVLDKKSERLKQLILDLIEVSKTSTGNIELEKINMNLIELIGQAVGEYEDKFAEKKLDLVESISSDRIIINADGRRIFRVIDNIFGNAYKYSMEGTRVYLNVGMSSDNKDAIISLKNVSSKMLNISAEELTERFVRGDKSRSTEGSGLGLSIAKNLTELHGGTFRINIDGDLFKVIITLPVQNSSQAENSGENVESVQENNENTENTENTEKSPISEKTDEPGSEM